MMLRSRANEIPELIRRLGSRSRVRVDAARARLSIIGGRAVEDLVEALEGTDNRIRARVMPLLALIGDSRGREPLIAMLLDRNARMRAIAARCLGRFPSPDGVAALNRALERESSRSIRVAAVHSLVEQYAAGQDQAIRRVLDLLLDSDGEPAIREAAFELLGTLRPAQRRSMLRRLVDDPDPGIRARAAEGVAAGRSAHASRAEIRQWIGQLSSDDYTAWNEAVRRLGAGDASAIRPLLDEMRRRAHDPEFCTRAGMVLKALGPRRCRAALSDALDELDEALPLQVIVEVVGALGEKPLIYRLKELIERLAEQPERAGEPNGFDLMLRVRARAHLELARIGSRVAIQDLRDCLGDDDRRMELELLAAVEMIGKRDEIGLLLRAYGREDAFMQSRIGEAVRAIMKRERIRRNSRFLQGLRADQRRALEAIVPRSEARPRRPRRRQPTL